MSTLLPVRLLHAFFCLPGDALVAFAVRQPSSLLFRLRREDPLCVVLATFFSVVWVLVLINFALAEVCGATGSALDSCADPSRPLQMVGTMWWPLIVGVWDAVHAALFWATFIAICLVYAKRPPRTYPY